METMFDGDYVRAVYGARRLIFAEKCTLHVHMVWQCSRWGMVTYRVLYSAVRTLPVCTACAPPLGIVIRSIPLRFERFENVPFYQSARFVPPDDMLRHMLCTVLKQS